MDANDIIRISASRLSDWLDCRQRALFRREGWAQTRPKWPMILGDVVHQFLDSVYTFMKDTEDSFSYPYFSPDGIRKTVRFVCCGMLFKSSGGEDHPSVFDYKESDLVAKFLESDETADKIATTLNQALVMVQEYFVHYRREDFEVVSCEEEFEVPFKDGVMLIGRYDGIVRGIKRGRLSVFETKVKSRIDTYAIVQLANLSLQNRFYVYTAQRHLGKPITSVIYNVIRSPGLRRKKEESLNSFIERTRMDIQSKPDHYFVRVSTAVNPGDVRTFMDDLEMQIDDYCSWYRGETPTYPNNSGRACMGQFNCEYMEACACPGIGIESTGSFKRNRKKA